MPGRAASFTATVFKHPGAGGWTFARIPKRHAPPATHPWGRTPVTATVGGKTWDTSVWKDRTGETLLALPGWVRGTKGDGDTVRISLVRRSAPGRRGIVRPGAVPPRA